MDIIIVAQVTITMDKIPACASILKKALVFLKGPNYKL